MKATTTPPRLRRAHCRIAALILVGGLLQQGLATQVLHQIPDGDRSTRAAARRGAGAPGPSSAELAAFAEVFRSMDGATVLYGEALPLVGAKMSLKLRAPGFAFAIIVMGLRALPQEALISYHPKQIAPLMVLVDPTVVFDTFAIPVDGNGNGSFTVLLPRDNCTIGVDLVWQGIAFGLSSPVAVDMTNLVLANIGTSASDGVAMFESEFAATLASGQYHRTPVWNRIRPFYLNRGKAHYLDITASYSSLGMGPLSILIIPLDESAQGWVLAQVPAASNKLEHTVRVFVPPGLPEAPLPLTFRNETQSTVGFRWRVQHIPWR